MKIALVHDHLNQIGGAEKVLHTLHRMWPSAPIFTLQYDKDKMGSMFEKADVRTSFIDRAPFGKSRFQWYLPLMPTATELYDLSEFDVVISSVSAFAKGVITKPNSLHICYCHTPTRYLWSDTKDYVNELRVPGIIKRFLPLVLTPLRIWDRLAADRVDVFVANSRTVNHRIQKYYKHDSHIIYPPVDVSRFSISDKPKEYFLIGGRLVAYKRYDLVIETFTKLGLPLKVFGSGPIEENLKKLAGPNVEFLGRVSDEKREELFQNAKAFLHPQEEDFGITLVESMAAGRPVIAYRRGGALESIIEGKTGEFFDEQSWERLADVVMHFNETKYNPEEIRAHALKYSSESFEEKFREFVNTQYDQFCDNQTHPCE